MKYISMTLIVLALSGVLMAQMPLDVAVPGNRPLTELRAALALTDAQVQQLIQISSDRMAANRSARTQIAAKEASLRDTLNAGGASAATVGQLVLDIDALRKQVKESDTSFSTTARAVLSASQLAQLKGLEDAAKLEPAIRQAIGLNLIAGPAPAAGRGFGGPMMGRGQMRGGGMMIRRQPRGGIQ
jgi:hypothetical protein